MNRRQFFQAVVTVVAMPEVKPPFVSKLYRGGRLVAYDIETMHLRIVKEALNASYGKILYFDTDGMVTYQ